MKLYTQNYHLVKREWRIFVLHDYEWLTQVGTTLSTSWTDVHTFRTRAVVSDSTCTTWHVLRAITPGSSSWMHSSRRRRAPVAGESQHNHCHYPTRHGQQRLAAVVRAGRGTLEGGSLTQQTIRPPTPPRQMKQWYQLRWV